MFVKQYGDGPAAYFCIHGWSGDHASFAPLKPYLPESVRLYAVDLPGCGQSPPLRNPDLEALTSEIVRVASDCSSPLSLVGNCSGALLGLSAAIAEPELFHRLILIDAFASWPWYFRVFADPKWGGFAYAATFANPVGRWIANTALARRRTGDSHLTQGFTSADPATNLNYLRMLGEIESAQRFASLTMPIDVVTGRHSFRLARQSAAVWHRMWPQSRVWEIESAGHLLLQESPARLGEIFFRGETCTHSALTQGTTRN